MTAAGNGFSGAREYSTAKKMNGFVLYLKNNERDDGQWKEVEGTKKSQRIFLFRFVALPSFLFEL